jgi:hypothetical protein
VLADIEKISFPLGAHVDPNQPSPVLGVFAT